MDESFQEITQPITQNEPSTSDVKKVESKPEKITLPAVEVRNHVLSVNKAFPELPFKLDKDTSTSIGMFLTPKPQFTQETFPLEVQQLHYRSGLIGKVVFKDEDGNLYRDVDVKGIGHIGTQTGHNLYVSKIKSRKDGYSGILDFNSADRDMKMAEELFKKGVRVVRTIAIIGLDELIDNDGKRITIEEARERKIIGNKTVPVIALRAFGTKTRLVDVWIAPSEEREYYVSDARRLVSKELGKDFQQFSLSEYNSWLAQITGKNLGLMHKKHLIHNYLGAGHNITIDGRLVDFDSITSVPFAINPFLNRDINDVKLALRTYYGSMSVNRSDQLLSEFEQSYIHTKKTGQEYSILK